MRPHEEKEHHSIAEDAEKAAKAASSGAEVAALHQQARYLSRLGYGLAAFHAVSEVTQSENPAKELAHQGTIFAGAELGAEATLAVTTPIAIGGGPPGIAVAAISTLCGAIGGACMADYLWEKYSESSEAVQSGIEFLTHSFDALQMDFRKSRFLLLDEDSPVSLSTINELNHDLPIAMQSAAITLTPEQQESLRHLHQEIQAITTDIHQLQNDAKNNAEMSATLQTNIDLKIARASQLITDCKKEFGVIHHDQDKLTHMMGAVFDASTKVDIQEFPL